jgi:hypothetical protein
VPLELGIAHAGQQRFAGGRRVQWHARAETDVSAQHLWTLDALHEEDRPRAQHAERDALVAAACQLLHRPEQPRAESALLDRRRADLEDAQPDAVGAARRIEFDHAIFAQGLQQEMGGALAESQLAGEWSQPQRSSLGQEVEGANGVAHSAEGAFRHPASCSTISNTV